MQRPNRTFSRTSLLACAGLLALGACGPMSPERAAEYCADRARAAAGPQAEAKIGVGSGGAISGATISISSDYLAGRDPQAVYDSCVREKTGQGPIMPLQL